MRPRQFLPPARAETDITGETDLVGNGEFLLAVFGDALVDARPVVVSFDGQPRQRAGQGLVRQAVAGQPEIVRQPAGQCQQLLQSGGIQARRGGTFPATEGAFSWPCTR